MKVKVKKELIIVLVQEYLVYLKFGYP